MNSIVLSKDKKFFEVWHNGTLIKTQPIWTDKYRLFCEWHNGTLIKTQPIWTDKYQSFCECLIYLYKWTGDQSPTIAKEVIHILAEVQPYIAKE